MFLTDAPLDPRALVARVMRASDGAYVLFEGVVRNHHHGKAVTSIFYDAYRPMAEKELARIVRDVETEFPETAVAVQHRLGQLDVGESSIAIVAASPHRAEAFAACRALIDRIKETVPIWKKERGPDGEEWVGWQGRS
ncbi:MAG: molybdenum cofactor biosynthesis protein MoaE [Acidobacteria bacterium]|nr:molybdenum cofactor biosynthesis protein MoaE [Acidobacteriota bacterium]MBV9477187.1 molybdenum cofactor biosynthesis protein MoaE [Acidobacteriota bacterium]